MSNRIFDITYIPEGNNRITDVTVASDSGLGAIEKLKRIQGQGILILTITEVDADDQRERSDG